MDQTVRMKQALRLAVRYTLSARKLVLEAMMQTRGDVSLRKRDRWLIHAVDIQGSEVTNISAKTEHSPPARVGSAATVLNGQLFMYGGRGGEAMAPLHEDGAMWTFDLRDKGQQGWQMVRPQSEGPRPEPRSYHTMANNGVDTVYLHAGCPAKGRLSDLWAFDVSTCTWRELASAPDPPRGGPSLAYCDGKLYRMNGFDGNTEQGGAIDVYDLAGDKWTTVKFEADAKNGPGARSVAALLATSIHGKQHLVTIFGESDPSSLGHQGAGKMLRDAWAFDLARSKWTQVEFDASKAPEARGWFDADVARLGGEDRVVVVGGLGENNERLGDVWVMSFA